MMIWSTCSIFQQHSPYLKNTPRKKLRWLKNWRVYMQILQKLGIVTVFLLIKINVLHALLLKLYSLFSDRRTLTLSYKQIDGFCKNSKHLMIFPSDCSIISTYIESRCQLSYLKWNTSIFILDSNKIRNVLICILKYVAKICNLWKTFFCSKNSLLLCIYFSQKLVNFWKFFFFIWNMMKIN